MDTDRAEKENLAGFNPEIVHELEAQWEAWANRVGVVPWDKVLAGYRAEGKNEAEATG
jgi:arylsulfatase